MSTDVAERVSSTQAAAHPAGQDAAAPPQRAASTGRARALARRGSALLVGLAGALCLAEVVSSSLVPERVFDVTDDAFWQLGLPTGPSLVVGVALLVLAPALRAGKRAGWWVLLVLLALSSLGSVVVLLDALAAPSSGVASAVVGLVLPVAWLGALVVARRGFEAVVPPGAWLQALVVAGTGLGSAVVVGWAVAGGAAPVGAPHDAWPRLVWVLDQLTGGTFELAAAPLASSWLTTALDLTGGVVLVAALALFLRSVDEAGTSAPADELALRQMLAEHGGDDSLGWFATRRDKRVVLSPDGRAAVAYRVVAGSAVASGDPVGDPRAWAGAVDAWLAQARRYGWQPVVLGAGEAGAAQYRRHGLRVRRIGDEAVVSTSDLLRDGGQDGRVRRAVRRLSADGVTVSVRRVRDVPAAELAAVEELAAAWRAGEVERGFSMASGRAADPADLDVVLVEARRADGTPCGLLTFAPWGSDGLSLDLMLRSPEAPSGVVEHMVGQLAAAVAPRGVRRLSMNFVVLREALESGARLGASPGERARRALLRGLSAVAQVESLHRSSLVYQPTWSPRLLCWSGSGARAVAAAVAAEGFLEVPGLGTARRTAAALPRGPRFLEDVRRLETTWPDGARVPGAPASGGTTRAESARHLGQDPHPALVGRVDDISELLRRHAGLGPSASTGATATVAGRVRARRTFGSISFAVLHAGDRQVQVIVDKATSGPEALSAWKAVVGLGDLVLVTGEVVTSRAGELSVLAHRWELAAASERRASTDPLAVAARGALLQAGYAEATLPPLHPASPGGWLPAQDGAVERLFHLDDDGGRVVLHVRESLQDAAGLHRLLGRVSASLPRRAEGAEGAEDAGQSAGEVERPVAVVDAALPAATAPLARPLDADPLTADAWRLTAEGQEVASASTGLTDPVVLRHAVAPGPLATALSRGIMPFAVMTADLTALAQVEMDPGGGAL